MKALKNVAASVHQRLLNLARQTGRPFNELAQYYALERWALSPRSIRLSEFVYPQGSLDAARLEDAGYPTDARY